MTRLSLILLLCCSWFFAPGQHTVNITINILSAQGSGHIYIAGSFNGWRPADENFTFQQSGVNTLQIKLQLADGNYEYKITRGGWDKVECDLFGKAIANRSFHISRDTAFTIVVENWQDNFAASKRSSTAGKNVTVLDTAFYIPQLDRKRRIWLYLPAGHNSNAGNRYPVLYLHDGQNVFDEATSFSGEWAVDEFLDTSTLRSCIVVAIDNGGDKRLNEYCPYDFSVNDGNTKISGKGEGDKYVDFIVHTLKPYIDQHFRTLTNRANTFIAGSSMGGLISLYAVLKYPKVFGGAGIFSPAFWIAPRIYDDIKTRGRKVNANLFFYAGGMESESMEPEMVNAADMMIKISRSKIKIRIKNDGRHNESNWREMFPAGYDWMVNRQIKDVKEVILLPLNGMPYQ